MTRRSRLMVVRKQSPDMPRPGEPMRWCAGCQRCSNAAVSIDWARVVAWADSHARACKEVPLFMTLHQQVQPTERKPQAHEFWRTY